MYCTGCGNDLRTEDFFCPRCGKQTAEGRTQAPLKPLMLDKRNKKIAGVCAGFARYFDMDLTLMRVIWLVVAICTGVGFIAYPAAWLLMSSDHGVEPYPAPAGQPQVANPRTS